MIKIIPAIDIWNNNIVALTAGDYNQISTYSVSLPEMLEKFSSVGTDLVHVIDINGARGEENNHKTILKEVKNIDLRIQLGGGIRDIAQIKKLLAEGISRVVVGTAAITNKDLLKQLKAEVNHEKIVIAVDLLDGVIKHTGWLNSSELKPRKFIEDCVELGFSRFLCTDLAKDGKMAGASIKLYKQIKDLFPFVKLIASGGVRTLNDVKQLDKVGCEAVIIGKAIYENKISIEEINDWNLNSLSML
ncbi:MAG: phosphoribosylformimino-5-aminoimidazole carboxamide ribotide isomerase [Sphingobacteriales bacterium]|jgi:phosphoribosylformimino-5-aminoimidazole carboxamide ribotide isomerase